MATILMFYGTECVHCHEMDPIVAKLEGEGTKVEKLEIWHNAKNKERYDKSNKAIKCTGVPYFYNEKTKKGICGATSYEELKKLAQG